MRFEIGKTYGGYEFLDTLGSSKTVLAYRVRNLEEQRTELLRILPHTLGGDQERQERFLREIRVRGRLVHPNIVTFFHAGELEGQLVLTTELVEGPTLAERLELGPLSWPESIAILSQVLSALSCAHSHGVVHREVTPKNIILIPDKTVKLSGFGLAKASTDAQLTQAGAVMGELKYMAPEQVKGLATLDGRSDIYSAGAVLYEAVTGMVPFDSKGQFDLMLAQVTATPQAPSKLRAGVPTELDDLILTALAKDPSQRFQTADEFRQALEAMSAAADRVADRADDASPAPEPEERQTATVISMPSNGHVSPSHEVAVAPMMPAMHTAEPLTMPGPPQRWGSVELTLAGICMFIVATMAFLAFLTMRS